MWAKQLIALTLFAALAVMPPCVLRAQWVQTNGPPAPMWFASDGPYLFALAQDGLFRSTDSGATYSLITSSVATELVSHPIAIKDSHIYVAHINGVFHSADSGKTWINDTAGLPPACEGDIAIIDSTVVVTLHDGTIFRSSDGGHSWKKMDSTPGPIDCLVSIGKIGFLTDSNRIFRSNDDGEHWTIVKTSFKTSYLATNEKRLFAGGAFYSDAVPTAGADGFYRSDDIGATWENVSNGLGADSSNIGVFTSSGNTILVGEPGTPSTGYIYLSSNNGASWMNFGSVHRFNGLGSIGDYAVAGSVFGTSRRSLLDTSGLSDVGVTIRSEGDINSHPNPFSQSTQITFTSESAGYADISIVNLLGEQVARIFSGELDAGPHNFTFSNTADLPDGTYQCLLRINGRVKTLPMVKLSEP